MDKIRALLCRLLSYRKKSWTLDDYPIRLRKFDVEHIEQPERFKPIKWSAQIINWWQAAGHGDTEEEAMANLRQCFENYRLTHTILPRPGTGVPLEFASSELVEKYEEIAPEFFSRILEMNYEECFISDESSLWDFHGEETNDDLYRKISEAYGVDVSDISGAKLGLIFQRIASKQTSG